MTDMNPHASNERPVTDERLSAYFDGEASPDERAAIESLLDDSLDARRELDEISRLSALLHSFPRESAPAELVANVQRQTDRMPLAAQAVTPAVPARSLRREWTAAISGAVVTAAALFVMASVVDNTGSRGLTSVRPGHPQAVGLATEGNSTHGSPSPATAMQSAPAATTGFAGDAPALASTGNEALFEASQNRALGSNLSLLDNGAVQNFSVSNPDFLNGLKAGEVYEFVPQVADNGSNVAVVDLRVLDVERGVDRVQVLLSQNSIQPRLAGQWNDLEKQKAQKLREQSKAGGHEMVVVYSVGPGEQLAKTLEDMQQHPDLFFGWSSQPPVQLPSGDELAASQDVATSAKDATVPAEKPTADKSNTAQQPADRKLAERRKEAAASDDDMADEAELAVNALLLRNTYSNFGIANFSDSNTSTANFGAQNIPLGMTRDGNPFSRAGAAPPAGAPNTAAFPSAKTRPADPKSAPPSAVRSQSVADQTGKGESVAKKSGDQKQDADVRQQLARQSSFQTTFRVPTDTVPPVDQAMQLNRSNTASLDNTSNRVRRSYSNAMQQQAEGLSRASANSQTDANRVKVLFVLHPMPAPTAAAAPAGKSNP